MLIETLKISNYQWNPWAFPPVIGCLYFIILGSFVYLKNRRSALNISFGFLCFLGFIWQAGLIMMLMSKPPFYPLFWSKCIGSSVVFIDLGFYLFIINFISVKNRLYKSIAYLILAKGILFGIMVVSSDLILTDLKKHAFGYYLKAGRLHPLFLAFFLFVLIYSFSILFQYYRSSGSRLKKIQAKYIFLSLIVLGLASVDYVPMYLKISLYPFGDVFVVTSFSILAYAIIRYRALEIDTVVHRTFLWLVSILFLILPVGLAYGVFRARLFGTGLTGTAFLISLTLILFLVYYNAFKPRIDHFFRRKKYDYQMVLAEMPSRIGSSLDLQVLSRNLFRELKEILYIKNALLLIKPPDTDHFEVMDYSGYQNLIQQSRNQFQNIQFSSDHPLINWFKTHQRILEKDQVEMDSRYAPVREEALKLFNACFLEVLVPVTMQDKLVSILGLGKKENLRNYLARDIELLESIGKQIGITLDNALHHGDIVEKERIAEELKLGRQIQTSLLPHGPPQVMSLSIHGLMEPAKEIGGDYFDFISLAEKEKAGIVIGDVSGKGVAAGLLMAMVKTAVYIFSRTTDSPKDTLMLINDILVRHTGGDKFMTMLYLIWDARTLTLKYSSAGHEHILLLRNSSRDMEVIESGGLILGIRPDIGDYLDEKELKLNKGDKLLLYTDGATEAPNFLKERFGMARLQDVFIRNQSKASAELLQAIRNEIFTFIGTQPQADDITLVVLEA
ncbi:MAG: SpoIIE family protein phosphatase [bacterium]|nr:SpoIIE family protein phosphatase [bacterium]